MVVVRLMVLGYRVREAELRFVEYKNGIQDYFSIFH